MFLNQAEHDGALLSAALLKRARIFATVGLGAVAALAILGGLANDALPRGLLAGVALVMALLPAELPMVLKEFLTKANRRLADAHVVLRPGASVETLGAISVLCVDAEMLRRADPAGLKALHAADIRLVVVSSDKAATARHIAQRIGLNEPGTVLTGAEVDRLDDAGLDACLKSVVVCAEITPKHRVRLVEALKRNGEVVAVTGSGIDDVPALRSAHIGVAMNGRGTDAAREAVAMLLLDDDLGSLVKALRLARRSNDNIRKAASYVLALHVPLVGLVLVPFVEGWLAVMSPVHVAFFEFVIIPLCAMSYETEPQDTRATRPGRPATKLLIMRSLIRWSLVQGLLVLILLLGFHAALRRTGMPDADARAITFVSLVANAVTLIFVGRSFSRPLVEAARRPNARLWRSLVGLIVILAVILYTPLLRTLFDLGTLHWDDVFLSLGASAVLVYGLEVSKRWLIRRP